MASPLTRGQGHLLRRRFFNQYLTGAPLDKPEEVVRWLGAVQSQDYLGAKWSVGQRVREGTDAQVEQAFAEGKFLRTHVLRPTWHFVAREDIRWMLQLTAPHVRKLAAGQFRKMELDGKLFARAHGLFERVLRDGSQRTRAELGAALEKVRIVAAGQRLADIMMEAELAGLVCSGAPRGAQQTYALLEERVPPVPTLTRDAALAELMRRFFASHGPATMKHFTWWSGLSVADAKSALALIRTELVAEMIDGAEWLAGARPSARAVRSGALLIPEYDEALVGARDLKVQDMPGAGSAAPRAESFDRPIIIDDRRAGSWRRSFVKSEAVIETRGCAPLTPAQARSLGRAVSRYGVFIGMPARLA